MANKNIDWEQRRYEIAKELYVRVVGYPNTSTAKMDSKTSIDFADAIIAELQKTKEQDKFSRIVEQAPEMYKALKVISYFHYSLISSPSEKLNEVIEIAKRAIDKCNVDYPEIEV